MALRDLNPLRPALVALVVLVLVGAGVATLHTTATPQRTVTAHFSRAVSVYPGTDVRILGVNVGHVTSVTPDGDSVEVEIEYDPDVKVPADAKAVVVTPTLVADRFVQLTPAYQGGEVMADGADIPLPDTGVPVELDHIYGALRQLSVALGPNGVNKDGTLSHLLTASARALDGQGKLGNQMLTDLSRAAETFGNASGPLFDTVTRLATLTTTLAGSDSLVRAFTQDLAKVSSQLAGERVELRAALAEVARSVGTVRSFVKGSRSALNQDLRRLTRIVKTVNSERDAVDDALRTGPVALGNLSVAFDVRSGTVGSRIGANGNFGDLDGFLCALVQQDPSIPAPSKKLACTLFKQIIEPALAPTIPAKAGQPARASGTGGGTGGGAGAGRGTSIEDLDPGAQVSREHRRAQLVDPQLSDLYGGAS